MKTISSILTVSFLLISFNCLSTTYTFNGPGDWDEASLWSPSYPGLEILDGDEAIIIGDCFTNDFKVDIYGLLTIDGHLTIDGPFLFINTNEGEVVVNGNLTVNHFMYNQGLLTVENEVTINHEILNFNDIVNNGTIYGGGLGMNSSGSLMNNGTYVDLAGFFEQGVTTHVGVWEGHAHHMNNDFYGSGGYISPAGSDQFGDYTFFSGLIGVSTLYIEIGGTGGAGIDHDKIIGLTGINAASLSLEVYLNDGFEPAAGDSFEFLSADGGIVGDFSDPYSSLPTLNAGLVWVYVNDGNTMTLSVESTLAVELCPIELTEVNNNVLIEWCSYFEINHDYYRIERSRNLDYWLSIGKVTGKGLSYELTNYEFTDMQANFDGYYYRIVAVDFAGEEQYSEIVHIDLEKESELRLWPSVYSQNDDISINIAELPEGNCTISIYNSLGKKVLSEESHFKNNLVLKVNASLAIGKYFVLIENDSQRINKSFLIH